MLVLFLSCACLPLSFLRAALFKEAPIIFSRVICHREIFVSLHWTSAIDMKAIKRKKWLYEAHLTFTPLHHPTQVNTGRVSIKSIMEGYWKQQIEKRWIRQWLDFTTRLFTSVIFYLPTFILLLKQKYNIFAYRYNIKWSFSPLQNNIWSKLYNFENPQAFHQLNMHIYLLSTS